MTGGASDLPAQAPLTTALQRAGLVRISKAVNNSSYAAEGATTARTGTSANRMPRGLYYRCARAYDSAAEPAAPAILWRR